MTVSEILSNEELRRGEFPVTREKIFLAHAGVCPLPARVARAMTSYLTQATLGDQEMCVLPELAVATRELAAKLLRVTPGEIAFVGPTSLALSYVAAGLPVKPGDNVIAYADDYPSNVYPWMALADRGVETRLIRTPELGRIELADVLARVDSRTRLVALSSCHFISGRRLDYEMIGRELRHRGIWFCLDAIQTFGAFPMNLAHVDFAAADAHKWMLGPAAAGVLYVRRELQEQLRPTVFGWNNVRCPNFVAQEQLVFRRESHRYEVGTHNLAGLVGLRAAIEMLLEVGVEAIAQELLQKRSWLVPALQAKGFTVPGADGSTSSASGLVSAFREGADLPAMHQKLAAAGVVSSLRVDRAGRRYLRFSPHFYNTMDELHRAVALL